MGRKRTLGFTLIEVVVTLVLLVIMMAVTLKGFGGGPDRVSTLALATAIADELRASRELAVSNGHPVAIGIPAEGGEVATSIYRLAGWNRPLVTWSQGYDGDYPRLGFAAARWASAQGTFTGGAPAPPLSKAGVFQLSDWVPPEHQNDSIICFTPDGGVVTKASPALPALPALNDRYTIVVAKDPKVSGRTISAGGEAVVIYVSANGAVEVSKGTPGTSLPSSDSAPSTASYVPRETLSGSADIWLSQIMIRPDPGPGAGADAFCTPGQQVTFELYAYDPEGRELFTQWKQGGSTPKRGTFTFPTSNTGNLTVEAERMEWVPNPDNDSIDWNGAPEPPGGCFRSRWTWTVPVDSTPGDEFYVEADVQDATGNATVKNPPVRRTLGGPPSGRLLAEIWNPTLNRWEIVRMNPDGSGRQLLTPAGVEEVMPSVDGSGTKMAYLSGPIGNINARYVKIRSLTGGGEFTIAGPAQFTSVSISPDGQWVSYRNNGTGTLYFRKVDGSKTLTAAQSWGGSVAAEPKSRTGWSADGRYAVWENNTELLVTDLTAAGNNSSVIFSYDSGVEQLFAPMCFTPPPGGDEYVVFTIGNNNPVLGLVRFGASGCIPNTGTIASGITIVELEGTPGIPYGSGTFNDGLPCVSSKGNLLVLPREDFSTPNNARSALVAEWQPSWPTGATFVSNSAAPRLINQNVRSLVWLP